MSETTRRSTIYLKSGLHRALRIKAAETQRSGSDIVNEAVQMVLREDAEDLCAFEERAMEPTLTYEPLLQDLKAHGKIWAGFQAIRDQGSSRHSEDGSLAHSRAHRGLIR